MIYSLIVIKWHCKDCSFRPCKFWLRTNGPGGRLSTTSTLGKPPIWMWAYGCSKLSKYYRMKARRFKSILHWTNNNRALTQANSQIRLSLKAALATIKSCLGLFGRATSLSLNELCRQCEKGLNTHNLSYLTVLYIFTWYTEITLFSNFFPITFQE